MQEILIREELLEQTIEGKKTTTCRKGIRTYDLGETILKSNSSENFVLINITELKYYKMKDITDEIAKCDGFANRENFIKVMQEIYESINDDTDVTLVIYELA